MSDVTQNRFDKYFSGSELVVAGKVQPSESNKLISFTTASSVSLTMRIRDIYSLRYLLATMSLLVTIVRECCSAPPPRVLQARMDVSLETEADTSELDAELAKHQHSFTGFARQMWAYITIKQMISER